MILGMVLLVIARTQTAIARSSTEAEWYAGTSGAAEALYIRELLSFLGLPLHVELYMDSSGSRGVAKRQGVGRIRSLEVRTLWLQGKVRDGVIDVKAVRGDDNVADLGAKPLAEERLMKLAKQAGMVRWSGHEVRSLA